MNVTHIWNNWTYQDRIAYPSKSLCGKQYIIFAEEPDANCIQCRVILKDMGPKQ